MKFEFVEFYENNDETKARIGKKHLGTVHIYAIDCELDIRGIRVIKHGRRIHFNFPYFHGIDQETSENISYPLIRFTNEKTHQEMMDFLKKEVKKEIMKRLNIPNHEVKLHDSESLESKSEE